MSQTVELFAPADWHMVDFISDLHLHANEPATFDVWQRYMQSTPADAVFILGDLFEVWVGDDVVSTDFTRTGSNTLAGFESQCASVLADTASRLDVFFMHGNRDFLVGSALMELCKATLLADPTVLQFSGSRWLLSHGDALCLDDLGYLKFRDEVRTHSWQKAFLAKSLAERKVIASGLRQQSEERKRSGLPYADVDREAAREWLRAARASTLIHGHTHRPLTHDLGDSMVRVVLSDWDANAESPRADVLRLDSNGLRRVALL